MAEPSDRSRSVLATTFDRAAEIYDRARPDYPDELFDDLARTTGLAPGARVLEIGCATGKATRPLARRGFTMTCLEPGPRLAATARANLAGLDVEVIERRFEDWEPRRAESFDLVFAASAWHWIDPRVRYVRAAEILRPRGNLAFWNAVHVFPAGGDPFFTQIQDVYEQIGEGLPADATWPRPGELRDERAEVEASGLFDVVHVRQFDWECLYTVYEYIELLNTFSGHLAMERWKREHLYAEIRARLGCRPEPHVRRHWGAVLHVARRRS
jgi:SAM-dependent methyltransferase